MHVKTLLTITCLAFVSWVSAQQGLGTYQNLVVGEERALEPGYGVGDISIANPKIADYRVIGAGRRSILLMGRGAGSTTLIVWDQRGVKRDEVAVTVVTREAIQLERDLRELLKDFPDVELRTLAGTPVIAGSVQTKEDLAAVERIATAARVRSVVRLAAPAGPPGSGGGKVPSPSGTGSRTADPVRGPGGDPSPPVESVAGRVIYYVELLEASTQFRSGSYATGVEPSGTRLYSGQLVAATDVEGELFIGGASQKTGGQAATLDTGLRLRIRPSQVDARGRIRSEVSIETNLPFDGASQYDPAVWRRARWEFAAASGEPFAISGTDLLAAPAAPRSGGGPNTAQRLGDVARLPGVSRAPGAAAVPIFGRLFGSSNFKGRKTQLLVLIRPQVERADRR